MSIAIWVLSTDKKGLWLQALDSYEQALRLIPEETAAYNNVHCAYQQKGQWCYTLDSLL